MRFVIFIGASLFLCNWAIAQNLEAFIKAQESHYQKSFDQLKKSKTRLNVQSDSVTQIFVPWLENDALTFLSTLNADAATNTNVSILQSSFGAFALTGEGVICGIWEDGLVANHVEFQNRILTKEGTSFKSHATHVTGTILASGELPSAKGMAPAAQANTYFFDNDLAEMAALQLTNRVKVSNHSYGTTTGWARVGGVWFWFGDAGISTTEDYKHGFYTNRTKAIDQLVNLSPDYTIVWPAGNDRGEPGDGTRPSDCNQGTGYDCIIPEAVAKNVITVGAINKFSTYSSPLSITISSFSSFGPTDDGRIKPDIVAPGVNILSTGSGSPTQYINSSGTSMAAPVVTGAIVLLQELEQKLTGSQFKYTSTVKSLLIHTAKETGPQPGPDYSFGWGLLDASEAASTLLRKGGDGIILKEAILKQNETHEVAIRPVANQKVKITICWTDPEAEPIAPIIDPTKRMLINDLDIRLVDDLGNVHFPWILNPTIPQAQATKGDNNRDNVEKIELETPFNRNYRILISHKGTLKNTQQIYSLWISYTPDNQLGKTFYRIGAGNWNDGTKWSLTSGGVAANQIPGENDRAIIDNKSFQPNDVLQLTNNVQVKDIIAIGKNNFKLDLNGFEINIGSDFSWSIPNSILAEGKINFIADGTTSILNQNLDNIELNFLSGNRKLSGDFNAEKITINNQLQFNTNTEVNVNELMITSNARINFNQSILTVKNLNWQGNHEAENLLIESKSIAEFNFNNNLFSGKIVIPKLSELKLTQSNVVQSIEIFGKLILQQNCISNELTINNEAQIQWLNNSTFTIENNFDLNESNTVFFNGVDGSTLNIQQSVKLCLKHATVNNVDLQGNAAISLVESSAATQSIGWQTVTCDDILMADFIVDFVCAGGMIRPVNKSLGSPDQMRWTVSNNENFESMDDQPFIPIPLSSNNITITLAIEKNGRTHQASKTVKIAPNTIPENRIVLADDRLVSLQTAESYLWFANSLLLENQNERFFSLNNVSAASYQVLIADENCNRLSEPFLITKATLFETDDTEFFPNPSNGKFSIKGFENESPIKEDWRLMNALGMQVNFEIDRDGNFDLGKLADGVYFLSNNKNINKVYRLILRRN